MHHTIPMAISNRGDHLRENPARFHLRHATSRNQMIKDFSLAGIFSNNIDRMLRLHQLVKPCNMRMSQSFQILRLSHDLRQVVNIQRRLVDYFDGHLQEDKEYVSDMI